MLATLHSFSCCDGYLSRPENREPQQALGAEPEQVLQSKIPGSCTGHVRESPLCSQSLSEVSLRLLQNVLLLTVHYLSALSAYHHLRAVKPVTGLVLAKRDLIKC